jgi:hypothetical protein
VSHGSSCEYANYVDPWVTDDVATTDSNSNLDRLPQGCRRRSRSALSRDLNPVPGGGIGRVVGKVRASSAAIGSRWRHSHSRLTQS